MYYIKTEMTTCINTETANNRSDSTKPLFRIDIEKDEFYRQTPYKYLDLIFNLSVKAIQNNDIIISFSNDPEIPLLHLHKVNRKSETISQEILDIISYVNISKAVLPILQQMAPKSYTARNLINDYYEHGCTRHLFYCHNAKPELAIHHQADLGNMDKTYISVFCYDKDNISLIIDISLWDIISSPIDRTNPFSQIARILRENKTKHIIADDIFMLTERSSIQYAQKLNSENDSDCYIKPVRFRFCNNSIDLIKFCLPEDTND